MASLQMTMKKQLKSSLMKDNDCILFNANMRCVFIEGILCDIKGYFESVNHDVVITFEKDSNNIISYRLECVANEKFDIQRMIETRDALFNVVDYIFGNDNFIVTKISYDSIDSYSILISSKF